jgi:CheY-like chemotaxis protein
VEDDYAFRVITERLLRKRGYTVLAARDGAHALEVAAAHAGAIDLVLTDLVMPRLSGRKLVEGLTRARGALPVLLMSGYAADAVASQGLLPPDARLLHKPFTPDELALAIGEVLRRGPHAPGAAATPRATEEPLVGTSRGSA